MRVDRRHARGETRGIFESIVATNLTVELGGYVKRLKLGAVSGADATFRMISGRIRLPDVGFISNDRLPTGLRFQRFRLILPWEVLSESNTGSRFDLETHPVLPVRRRPARMDHRPIHRAVAVYHAPGPSRTLSDSDSLDGENVVPGFSMPVNDLFGVHGSAA